MKIDKEKFIFVFQDVRGRFGSEGVFSHIRPHNPNKSGSDICANYSRKIPDAVND